MQSAALLVQYLCGSKPLPSEDGVKLAAGKGEIGPGSDGVFAIIDLGE